MTVINPLQTQLVRQAATKAGPALETAYNRKMTQAGEACSLYPHPMGDSGGLA